MLPIHQQDLSPYTTNTRGENGYWAGGALTKTPLRENGSRSSPGSSPILNGAAATSSGDSSAAPPAAISPCKSARSSAGCGKYEKTRHGTCWGAVASGSDP